MKTKLSFSLLAGGCIAVAGVFFISRAIAESHRTPLQAAAIQAASRDSAQSAAAIAKLREAGPEGLQALTETYTAELNSVAAQLPEWRGQLTKPVKPPGGVERWERIRAAFDAVGQQRDCHASKLFWFTDLDQAKAQAVASGKPILSLRLLGKLNEEYSCANSRFFRTTLYANAEVAKYLAENFVLHWQSVRPVPRITIDMGDGRRIERTITGNSIHYVLDAAGNPIDALPGLYGAQAFVAGLARARAAEQGLAKLNEGERAARLKNYHETRLAEIQQQWARDLAQVGAAPAATPVSYTVTSGGGAAVKARPDAIAAMPRAISKSFTEAPLLRAGAQSSLAADRARLEAASDEAVWAKIAALHAAEAELDDNAYKLIASKQPVDEGVKAMRRTTSKRAVETPMMRMALNLQRSIAEDTVRNEYTMHTKILEWFIAGSAPKDVDALNKKVYAELFLTPDSDPWLGLAPADTFSALDDGGLVQHK